MSNYYNISVETETETKGTEEVKDAEVLQTKIKGESKAALHVKPKTSATMSKIINRDSEGLITSVLNIDLSKSIVIVTTLVGVGYALYKHKGIIKYGIVGVISGLAITGMIKK